VNILTKIIIFLVSFSFAYFSVPYIKKLNIIDIPNARKIHSQPTPKAGGLAVNAGFLILILYLGFFSIEVSFQIAFIFLFSNAFLALGLFDDIKEVKAKSKLVAQIIIAILTVLSTGLYLKLTPLFFVNIIISILWVVGFVNAFNLIDGMDGLAAGIFIISLIGFGFLVKEIEIILLILGLIGSSLAFLKYNYNPAEIFLGDTGSLFMGYILAILAILYTRGTPVGFASFVNDVIVVGLILFIPIFDTLLSITRRKLNNRPIFRPDRSHFYNILEDDFNFSIKKTVNLIYLLNGLTVIFAVLFLQMSLAFQITGSILIVIMISYLVMKFDLLKTDDSAELIKED